MLLLPRLAWLLHCVGHILELYLMQRVSSVTSSNILGATSATGQLYKTSWLRRLLQLSVPPLELISASLTCLTLRLDTWWTRPFRHSRSVLRPRDRGVVARFQCRHSFLQGQRHFINVHSGRQCHEAAAGFKVDGYIVHSTVLAYRKLRVLFSHDVTTTTYIVPPSFSWS